MKAYIFSFIARLLSAPPLAYGNVCSPARSDSSQLVPLDLGKISAPPDGGVVKLHSEKLRAWSAQAGLPCPGAFKAIYQKGGKKLVYLAVGHVQGPARQDHPDFALIKNTINTLGPKSMLVEVVPRAEFPKEALTAIVQNCLRGEIFHCGEGAYAASEGGKAGARVWGGELTAEQLAPILSEKLGEENAAVYLSTQTLIGLKRQGMPPSDWKRNFKNEWGWTYERFNQWSLKHLGAPAEKIDDQWMAPLTGKDANPLQKISAKVDVLREPLILEALEKVINGGNPALAIYGSAHFYKQENALEEALGKPKVECLQ